MNVHGCARHDCSGCVVVVCAPSCLMVDWLPVFRCWCACQQRLRVDGLEGRYGHSMFVVEGTAAKPAAPVLPMFPPKEVPVAAASPSKSPKKASSRSLTSPKPGDGGASAGEYLPHVPLLWRSCSILHVLLPYLSFAFPQPFLSLSSSFLRSPPPYQLSPPSLCLCWQNCDYMWLLARGVWRVACGVQSQPSSPTLY